MSVAFAILAVPAGAQFGRSEEPPIPTTLERISADFLALGQRNPRGLDYREVVVGALDFDPRSRTNGSAVVTHGWVFSPREGSPTLQVLSWNGWTYPVLFLGSRQNVRADIEAVLQHEAHATSKDTRRFNSTWGSDSDNVSFQTLSPFKAVLLQQLGETDLARRVLLAWDKGKPTSIVRGQFTQEWMMPGVNRAVRAFRKGDDRAALPDLRLLARAPEALGLSRYARIDRDLVSELLTDVERRLKQNEDMPAIGTLDYLIWDLQNVRGAQSIFSSHFILLKDARIQALLSRGDETVEPLLAAFESDKRLTRQILDDNSHGPLFRGVTSVSKAALTVLEEFLKTDYDDDLWRLYEQQRFVREGEVLLDPKKLLARQIRDDWNKVRGATPLERPFLVLQDDAAGYKKWFEAADFLVTPPDWPATVPGEALRYKHSPSLSELLARRSNELASSKPDAAVSLALLLHGWDKSAGDAVVLSRMRELAALKFTSNSDLFGSARYLPSLLQAAPAEAGRQIYADWLRALPRVEDASNFLAPLWKNPNDPFWREVATDLFQSASPWSHVLVSGPETFHDWREISATPLLLVPAWNEIVRRDLTDKSPLGSVNWGMANTETPQLHFLIPGTAGWGSGFDPKSAGVAPSGETDLRVCDLIAEGLSKHWRRAGAPEFQAFWPRARRDAALQPLIDWVAAHNNDVSLAKFF